MTVHGKHKKRRRGVHKRAASPEVRAWDLEHADPPRPSWLDSRSYDQLAALKRELHASRL